jgi:hypothetical protein
MIQLSKSNGRLPSYHRQKACGITLTFRGGVRTVAQIS